jgi:hypothetical protein
VVVAVVDKLKALALVVVLVQAVVAQVVIFQLLLELLEQ